MNQLLRNLPGKLAACGGFVALLAGSSFAQLTRPDRPVPKQVNFPVHADIVAPTVPGQLSQGQIVVNRRTPKIKYEPFALVDPITGKPVGCDSLLPPLRNGKRLTACQYWKEMDRWEQQLTELGYTLRPSPGLTPGTFNKIPLQQIPTNTAKLDAQSRTFSAAMVPNLIFQRPNVAQALLQQKALLTIDPGILGAVGATLRPLTLKEVKPYNFNFGDPSVVSVFLNGNLELDGTSTSTAFDAEGVAGGSLFGQSFNALQLSGKLNAPQKGQLSLTITASVLGQNIYNVSQTGASSLSKSDLISKSLDESTSVNFTILFIPMTAKIGVQGTAGLSYGVTVAPVKAAGNIVPAITTNAYGQVSADAGIASAGISAKLVVLNLTGNLVGDLAIVPDAKSKATYSYDAQYCQSLDALDGSLVAFLDVGIGPVSGEVDTTLFSYTGIKSNGCLFSESKKSPVFEQPQATSAAR